MNISKHKIATIFNEATPSDVDAFHHSFNEYAKEFAVTTETHENMFLAQILAEVGYELKSVRENLNYTPSSLRSTFSRYKNNPNWSERDGRTDAHKADQEQIGDVAYADRLGNGNINSGDGYLFRGGGYFQLTGRSNYSRMSEVIQQTTGLAIGEENIVSQIEDPEIGVLTALAFWLDNECYECDHIDCVTAKINYYTNSYEKRKELYQWIATL